MKKCSECGESKPYDGFHKRSRTKDGYDYKCKECKNKYQRAWEARHPANTRRYYTEKRDSGYEKRRWHNRRKFHRHGISKERYDLMLNGQNGGCAICGSVPDFPLTIDHDHQCCNVRFSCGECIRGLLCRPCNAALGGFNDDPALLRSAADYLDQARLAASR